MKLLEVSFIIINSCRGDIYLNSYFIYFIIRLHYIYINNEACSNIDEMELGLTVEFHATRNYAV